MVRKEEQSYSENEQSGSENQYRSNKKDKASKDVQKQKATSKKEKMIQKEKVPKKPTKKEEKKEKKPKKSALIHRKTHQMKEDEHDSQNLFEMSSFNNQAPINENQQRSESESESEQSMDQSQVNLNPNAQNQEVFENLLMILMKFFISIEQQYGLAFKKQERKKLKKKNPNVNFTNEHYLQPQGKELHKIKFQIPANMLIFNKRNHNIQMTNKQFEQYIKKDIQKMICVFQQASYIFCEQVTHELYDILKKLCNIVVKDRNESYQTLVRHLRQFGDSIASQSNEEDRYLFFGYKFYTLSSNLSQEQIRAQQNNKNKNRYLLKRKYRNPGTQFAQFTQNAGLHLREIIKSLHCYQTLK